MKEHSARVVDKRALKFSNSRLCDVQWWSDDHPRGPSKEESIANARLIAAAPDLLDALTLMLDECHDTERDDAIIEAVTKARAAIAKATGEAS